MNLFEGVVVIIGLPWWLIFAKYVSPILHFSPSQIPIAQILNLLLLSYKLPRLLFFPPTFFSFFLRVLSFCWSIFKFSDFPIMMSSPFSPFLLLNFSVLKYSFSSYLYLSLSSNGYRGHAVSHRKTRHVFVKPWGSNLSVFQDTVQRSEAGIVSSNL